MEKERRDKWMMDGQRKKKVSGSQDVVIKNCRVEMQEGTVLHVLLIPA